MRGLGLRAQGWGGGGRNPWRSPTALALQANRVVPPYAQLLRCRLPRSSSSRSPATICHIPYMFHLRPGPASVRRARRAASRGRRGCCGRPSRTGSPTPGPSATAIEILCARLSPYSSEAAVVASRSGGPVRAGHLLPHGGPGDGNRLTRLGSCWTWSVHGHGGRRTRLGHSRAEADGSAERSEIRPTDFGQMGNAGPARADRRRRLPAELCVAAEKGSPVHQRDTARTARGSIPNPQLGPVAAVLAAPVQQHGYAARQSGGTSVGRAAAPELAPACALRASAFEVLY